MPATVTIDYGDGTIETVTISDAQLADLVCGNCGTIPCSHQCHHSPHFYSIEQERYDDVHGYHDQFDGWGDPEHYPEDDAPPWPGAGGRIRLVLPDERNDIPF